MFFDDNAAIGPQANNEEGVDDMIGVAKVPLDFLKNMH
jgi:hypothetical protein